MPEERTVVGDRADVELVVADELRRRSSSSELISCGGDALLGADARRGGGPARAPGTLSIAASTRSTAAASNAVGESSDRRHPARSRPPARSTTSDTCSAKSSSSSPTASRAVTRYRAVRVGRVSKSKSPNWATISPFGREMVEGGLDHLLRVQVALGEHEGARRGGVRGRVRVGSDEPDQVVVRRRSGRGTCARRPARS